MLPLSSTQTERIIHKPSPWGKESLEVLWPDSVPKAIVIELGTHIFTETHRLTQENLLRSLAGTNDQCFEFPAERFATTLEEFITKLAKMYEGSLQYIWVVASVNQSSH